MVSNNSTGAITTGTRSVVILQNCIAIAVPTSSGVLSSAVYFRTINNGENTYVCWDFGYIMPRCASTPTDLEDLTNKNYVDTLVASSTETATTEEIEAIFS